MSVLEMMTIIAILMTMIVIMMRILIVIVMATMIMMKQSQRASGLCSPRCHETIIAIMIVIMMMKILPGRHDFDENIARTT